MEPFVILEELRDRLAKVEGVKTCKIGVEKNLSPNSYPLIRIVPRGRREAELPSRAMEITIYAGVPTHDFEDGLDGLYRQLFELEERIREAIRAGNGYKVKWQETIDDDDRLPAFKLIAMRYRIEYLRR